MPHELNIPWAGPRAPFDAAHLPPLPHLNALLAGAGEPQVTRLPGGAESLSTPDEWLCAQQAQWPLVDGLLPLAAQAAAAHLGPGEAEPGSAWAFVTPAHARVGADQISVDDPAGLALRDEESQALFDAASALVEGSGARLHRWRTGVWLLGDARLATTPTASLQRAIGRRVDDWQSPVREAGWLRRWQAEVQMVWHTHAVNAARDAARLPAVNTLWVSGSGALPEAQASERAPATACDALRAPTLAQDEAGWIAAWQRLDAEVLAPLVQRAQGGEALRLTLTGDAAIAHIALPARGWLARRMVALRGSPGDARAMLQSLS